MEHQEPLSPHEILSSLCENFSQYNQIDPVYYQKWDVKRGLRNADGTGVVAGVTQIGNVRGYYIQDGEKVPMPGQLFYRGIAITDLIRGFRDQGRFGFAETAYLLLFGHLPNALELEEFSQLMDGFRALPPGFTEDMIIKAPSPDIMNKLARSVLALYSYDETPENNGLENELYHALQLIARVPTIVAHAFAVKRHYYDDESLYLHRPKPGLSLAEDFLRSIRPDNQYTEMEARLLDLCLVLHMEHGGGNNSAFACRVLSSAGTDIYSSIAAAVGSLKGPRHGGANKKVMEMFGYIEENVADWTDEDQVAAYLEKIARKQAGDGSGLIYGMGHAIYTLSDPRAVLLKDFARKVAEQKGYSQEFELFETVERLTPAVLSKVRGENKRICANVDMYSGLVYKMMNIPPELYTPLFAIARVVGWCAHRIEEVYNPGNKIIRPAYRAVMPDVAYVPLEKRP